MFYEDMLRRYQWGVCLQSLGIDPNIMANEDFDPADYGIAKRTRPSRKIV